MLPKKIFITSLNKREMTSLLWTGLAVCFVVAMILQPKAVFDGASTGLKAWWYIVFPSLLPFFIASELLMGFGLVRFIGVLLEPVMRPLFNVPGAGAFVMVIGFTSGFPIGSMVTAQLRQQGLCTRVEAERLMSFTNNSSPLFMLVAVSVGMFGRPELGVVIAGAHYLANILLGFLLRFYRRHDREQICSQAGGFILKRAVRVLIDHVRHEKRPLGKLVGDAVTSSIGKLLNIGGFIILFAVIIRLLTEAGFINWLAAVFGLVLIPLGFDPQILTALASGFFEMTIGTKLASEAAAPEVQRLMAVALILGWSGLSVHAQVASMIAEANLRMKIFVVTRVAHGLLAALFTWLLYQPEKAAGTIALPVISPLIDSPHSTFSIVTYSLGFMICAILFLLCLGLAWGLGSSLGHWIKNHWQKIF